MAGVQVMSRNLIELWLGCRADGVFAILLPTPARTTKRTSSNRCSLGWLVEFADVSVEHDAIGKAVVGVRGQEAQPRHEGGAVPRPPLARQVSARLAAVVLPPQQHPAAGSA